MHPQEACSGQQWLGLFTCHELNGDIRTSSPWSRSADARCASLGLRWQGNTLWLLLSSYDKNTQFNSYLCSTMNQFLPHSIDEDCTYDSGMLGNVKAGFPSPAEDIHEKLDLIRLLVRHRASTFFFRVDRVSMVDAGMDEGDIKLAVQGSGRIKTTSEKQSPHYTTRWCDIPKVSIK